MSTGFASYSNVFIPGFNAGLTEKLIVDYSRDVKKAPVNMLAGITTTPLPSGFFNRQKPEAQARLYNDPQGYEWPDNTPYPIQQTNRRDFDYVQYNCQRYTYSTFVGDLELEYAAWDVQAQVLHDLGSQAMLVREKQLYTLLNDTTQYLSGMYDTATNLGGGFWGAGSSANRYIEKTIQTVLQNIDKATVNAPSFDDLFLVVSPTVASAMARSQEVADTLIRQENYDRYLQYDLWQNQRSRYGLPPVLFGIQLVVDNWVQDSAHIGASSNKSYVPDANSAYVICKPGGIKSASGGKAFGSVEFFCPKGKEMVTEVLDIPMDKRKLIRVSDFFDVKLVARETTHLIQNVLS